MNAKVRSVERKTRENGSNRSLLPLDLSLAFLAVDLSPGYDFARPSRPDPLSRPVRFVTLARTPPPRPGSGGCDTPHGPVETPAFMPVGTQATVKGIMPEQVRATGSRMLLANTYHLALRPGDEEVAAMGGLHAFMGWDGPILTDSGASRSSASAAGPRSPRPGRRSGRTSTADSSS